MFGYETTSEMARRADAWAAVNGSFFQNYGEPIGFMVQKGQVQKMVNGENPVVAITDDRTVYVGPLRTEAMLEEDGKMFKLQGINRYPRINENILYTPVYGSTTRLDIPTINYIIKDHRVMDQVITDQPVSIPADGAVITALSPTDADLDLQNAQRIDFAFVFEPDIGTIQEAFMSGGWLVRDGKNVAQPWEPWMGLTTNREPRTALGVLEDGRILLVAVDGRQAGFSQGVSGSELAEILLSKGCKNAVYLDGGASTTMVLRGEVANSPSNEGKERQVGHSIVIGPSKAYFLKNKK